MAGYVCNLLSRGEIDAPNASGHNIALSRKRSPRCSCHSGRLGGNVCVTYCPLNPSLVGIHDLYDLYRERLTELKEGTRGVFDEEFDTADLFHIFTTECK